MEWEASAWAWVLKGDYPEGVVWVFVEQLVGEEQYHWIIVNSDRTFAEGYRFSFEASESAVSEHLSRI